MNRLLAAVVAILLAFVLLQFDRAMRLDREHLCETDSSFSCGGR